MLGKSQKSPEWLLLSWTSSSLSLPTPGFVGPWLFEFFMLSSALRSLLEWELFQTQARPFSMKRGGIYISPGVLVNRNIWQVFVSLTVQVKANDMRGGDT